ncbi:hypothetical protein ABEX39_15200 [Bacillus albus]|uniref:hypothetical protein n=1 Tax=Bacillus TaxID=1386 RepID=UPI0015D4C8F4|nr:hypothetical protein [Bacillus albus]MBF7156687.1 hypothetical protein [Bacillus albus]
MHEGRLAAAENPPSAIMEEQTPPNHPNGATNLVESILYRDRKLFLISATEKLLAVDKLKTNLKEFSNNITTIDVSSLDSENKRLSILQEAHLFYKQLDANKEWIYKNIDYDKVHMIDYYPKTLGPTTRKLPINEEEKDACIGKVQSIFGILLEVRKDMQNKYYKYKKEHNN